MPDIYVNNNFYMSTSSACIVDLTPPTFAGITGLDVESRGQIRSNWSAASDATAPIRYEVYIKASTNVGLFSTTNIISVTPNLQYDIFTLPDGSFLQNGVTYYVGIRAIDGVNNRDSNTVSMSVISTGVLTAIDTYETKASWSVDDSNQFRITMWGNKNSSLAIAPDAVLGTASYQVYNKAGTAIVGMSGTGITANSEGLFVATAVANQLEEESEHYEIKVTINIDAEDRVNFVRIEAGAEQYEVNGVSSLDGSNNLVGSFWVTENEQTITTGLGTGSYQAYTADGTLIPGLSETGIVADSNGFFAITPFPLPPSIDTTQSYIVTCTLTVHGTTRSHNIIIDASPTAYTNRATFSINASNQLEATFWTTVNDELIDPSLLGTASYTIYDKTGAAVAGLTQSGITPDGQGLFHITPVSAILLSDLTHYTAKITIEAAGQDRTVMKGFTLLGT
jgi:hypothetical protein